MKRNNKSLLNFLGDRRGSVAIAFTVALPLTLTAIAAAVDYAYLSSQQHHLQATADAAALASAKELALANRTPATIKAVAENYVNANGVTKAGPSGNAPIDVNSAVSLDEASVTVTLSQVWSPFFVHLIDSSSNPIIVTAKARVMGSTAMCVIGLEEGTKSPGIDLDNKAVMDANGCSVHSNASGKQSIYLGGQSAMVAASICAAGGIKTNGMRGIQPDPVTDCPPIDDPLIDRAAPAVGSCIAHDLVIDGTTAQTLDPGVYCGGITIADDANVTLRPGVFVIKDGPLLVSGNGTMTGVDVGFFLTGADSTFEFEADTHIDLEGPRIGAMAGLLFYEDRDVPDSGSRTHRISSNDARKLLGTIYLPESTFWVDADEAVSDRSAYTAIVAKTLQLSRGPTLYLNSDYDATEVPLPTSLAGGEIGLVN